MKLDVLAIVAHPDDVELNCSGTLIKHVKAGHQVGIVDLTEGEMSTRGTVATRRAETAKASEIMGIHYRNNLGMADAYFENNAENRHRIIQEIRHTRPKIVITNPPKDRHPDHGRAANLVKESVFYAGLAKIATSHEGENQKAWRPEKLFYFLQYTYLKPDLVVDISEHVEQKFEAIKAFKSQFKDGSEKDAQTLLSSPTFFDTIKARWLEMGAAGNCYAAEGFLAEQCPKPENLMDI